MGETFTQTFPYTRFHASIKNSFGKVNSIVASVFYSKFRQKAIPVGFLGSLVVFVIFQSLHYSSLDKDTVLVCVVKYSNSAFQC